MLSNKIILVVCCAMAIGLSGCSRQQSDWQKAREANTTEAYEQFLKKYPSGEFTAQAQARVRELDEERDWQKARDADTAEAYQAFVKQHPEGKWTEEARIRVENFTLAQTPASGAVPNTQAPPPAAVASPRTLNPPVSNQKPAAGTATHPGPYGIQLGAFKSGAAAADRRWAHLQKRYPQLLKGMSSKVVPKKTAAGTLYRLQAFGVTKSHARAICKSLKAKSQACIVVRPA